MEKLGHAVTKSLDQNKYLNLRNKLSELLIDLQGKINNIMNSFISDFKKTFMTIISFFISVIVIRVVSKGDFIGGFTNEIIGLSFIFLIISSLLLIYSRWELTKKSELYNKHYEQIKRRYIAVLSENELESIFEECDPRKDSTNNYFIEKGKKKFTLIWIASIILLSLFLMIIFFKNNQINIIESMKCFFKSISR